MKYEIYTDGSLKEGLGTWAFVLVQDGKILKESSGQQKRTTSNRMEFQAVIEALKVIPKNSSGTIYSDSRNVIDTVTLWKDEWKKLGWVKKYSKNIPEVDLIKELDELNSKHSLTWKWVRSHAGLPFNERCDQLCITARNNA